MDKKEIRIGLVVTPTEKAMLSTLAKIETKNSGEKASESSIIRRLIREAYKKQYQLEESAS